MSAGPLDGIRVIEVCDEFGEFAGKLLAGMGADVVKVEPPGGEATRRYGPWLDDQPGEGRSLWFWHYNTDKQSVELDFGTAAGLEKLSQLVAKADILVESKRSGLPFANFRAANPGLITVEISPFGSRGPRHDEPATDITLAANGGFAWMNGYDDHSLAPVRGGGNQALHTGCHYAVMSALTALLYRDVSGEGQHIEVDVNAAINVTTEAGSYTWLVAQGTVQRQTGRHAGVNPSMPSQVRCADGGYVNTGIPPRRPEEFGRLMEWMDRLGLTAEFPLLPLLELGSKRERIDLSRIAEDAEVREIFGAGREAFEFVASRISAYEFFTGGQERGFQVGVIYSPEEVFADPHFKARGWPARVEHPELGRSFTYPGQPMVFPVAGPHQVRPAPKLGEHTAKVLGSE
jgi:crotonobetainyl-CoA:carnitine CoA-transferase CaiB-like acyl-CoA transferase